jgi:hypothetical protein
MFEEIVKALKSGLLLIAKVARILWSEIKGWFKERITQIRSDINNLAFSIKDILESGEHQVIEGIYNKKTGALMNAQAGKDWRAPDIDEETAMKHRDHKMVIFD